MNKILKETYEQNSYDLAEMLIRKAFKPKELKKESLLPEWFEMPFEVMMRDEKSKKTYIVNRYGFVAKGSPDTRYAYRIYCTRDNEDDIMSPKDLVWKVVHPLTLKSYPIETFPAGEFPSEKEYEFITGYEYRKGNEVMLKKEDPLAYDPNLDQEDDRIDEICPELDEYGIDDTILEPEEDKFDGATFKSENGRIQKFDKESISKIAEAIVTKQYPKECSFYEAQSRTATKYLIMSCMSYLLEFATKKNITLENVCSLVAAGERVEYWKDDPLNTAYDCLLDEIREYIKKKKVPEPDCLQYYRIAMLGMKHNEVVGNALRAINEYISE